MTEPGVEPPASQPASQPAAGPALQPDSQRALVVTAHPDDVDFGSAGTVASWVDQGWTVTYCVCTDGDAGGFDPDVPRSQIRGIRQAEQRAAAAELGVTDVRFLGYADGALEVSPALVRDIVRAIRDTRPERVLMPSPERDWTRIARSHPDHLAAGEATIRAIYPAAQNPFAFPELLADEGLDAWKVPETWVVGHPNPDRFVDITDTFDRKIAALRRHQSQTSHMTELESMLRGWSTAMAVTAGLAEGRLVEAYNVFLTG